ncbi:uncharacterized protein LOC123007628 [Tribolium madens]|uniref:uncharacterized protein LOC123007628 n=1 Tax=Tribolium madens TaxID=41895 RepID=UPI001CF7270A|nr:uncharacterized protein LOC123007628 [Tribolium madens]
MSSRYRQEADGYNHERKGDGSVSVRVVAQGDASAAVAALHCVRDVPDLPPSTIRHERPLASNKVRCYTRLTMNIRLFISEIKKRQAVWDHTNRHYYDKSAVHDGWLEIAKIFNIEVHLAKQKWKNLRDTFRVELKKTKRYRVSDGTSRSLWAYYEDMYFIKDLLRTRRAPDAAPPNSSSETSEIVSQTIKTEKDSVTFSPSRLTDDNESKEASNIVIQSVRSLQTESEDVDTTNEQIIKRRFKRKWFNEEQTEGNEEDQDDDLLFFRSLLPFVKELDQDKKLLFRMNVQQMLYDQLYNN